MFRAMALFEPNVVDLVLHPHHADVLVWEIIEGIGWPEDREALLSVQFIVKTTRLRGAALAEQQRTGGKIVIVCNSAAEPPVSVLQLCDRLALPMTIGAGGERPAIGRPTRYPNLPGGEPDIDALQRMNASGFAARLDLDYTPESLDAVERWLLEARIEPELRRDVTGDVIPDGDLTVLVGAYLGEVLRRRVGGHWEADLGLPPVPVYLKAGPAPGRGVDVLGRAEKFLRWGAHMSLRKAAASVLTELGTASS